MPDWDIVEHISHTSFVSYVNVLIYDIFYASLSRRRRHRRRSFRS